MKIPILDYFEKKNFNSNWRLKFGSMILKDVKLCLEMFVWPGEAEFMNKLFVDGFYRNFNF